MYGFLEKKSCSHSISSEYAYWNVIWALIYLFLIHVACLVFNLSLPWGGFSRTHPVRVVKGRCEILTGQQIRFWLFLAACTHIRVAAYTHTHKRTDTHTHTSRQDGRASTEISWWLGYRENVWAQAGSCCCCEMAHTPLLSTNTQGSNKSGKKKRTHYKNQELQTK